MEITKQEIINLKDVPNFKMQIGLTSIKYKKKPNRLSIEHLGNMGAGWSQLLENLTDVRFPNVEELKNMFQVHKETGHPEYHYQLELILK